MTTEWKSETRQPSAKALARSTFLTKVLIPHLEAKAGDKHITDHDCLYAHGLSAEHAARYNLAGGRGSDFSKGCRQLGGAFDHYDLADYEGRNESNSRYPKEYLDRRRWQAITHMRDMFVECAAYMNTKLPEDYTFR